MKYHLAKSYRGSNEIVRNRPENKIQVMRAGASGETIARSVINGERSIREWARIEGCSERTIRNKIAIYLAFTFDIDVVIDNEDKGEKAVVRAMLRKYRMSYVKCKVKKKAA